MEKKIKAILIDSGRVLNRPRTGHWFITPDFFTYVDKKIFDDIPPSKVRMAFSKATEYISKQKSIVNLDEEYFHFKKYYDTFFSYLPELKLSNTNIENVTKDLVFNPEKYEFYKDVYDAIPHLSKKYKLAVVSDAWPSLEEVFVKADLRDYFSSFIISSVLGTNKPEELMYKAAIDELGVSVEETVFIDDNIINCNGAKKLGINSFLMCREVNQYLYRKLTCRKYKVIHNLEKLEKLLD
ncbi:HAD-IA family hydrolase [Tissierella sp.]|uniref:HAD-IA family hydrolase n=1 Tax=Tissierella sp. TaxID=41274 RepID=UPI0028625F09|nr:HAD-IA family hydrolase [Tissierella sp.]MDR7855399.1 HAD-IA family hydrolase [Tissierella sp.]